MQEISDIETRVSKIELRNKKVETDKAWETSFVRRFFITLFTYFSVGIYLRAIGVSMPWLNAIIPSLAFLLSTLTLPFIKKIWEKFVHQNQK